jgi:hypothetical protein
VVAAAVTAEELAAMQERILEFVRVELDQRAARPGQLVSVRDATAGAGDPAVRQVSALNRDLVEMLEALSLFYDESLMERSRTDQRLKRLQQQVETLSFAMSAGTMSPGGGQPR